MDVFQAVLIDALRSHFPKLHETIRLNLLRGRVDLRNIDLTESPPFVFSGIPFRISHGCIANLSLRIPWRSLRNSLIAVHVKDFTVVCEYIRFPAFQENVFNAFDSLYHQQKLRVLAEEERLQSPLSSIVEKLVPKALARLKVIIENATLRVVLPNEHVLLVSINNITISPNTTSSDVQELHVTVSSCSLQLSKGASEPAPLKITISSFFANLQHFIDSIALSFSFSDLVEINVDSSLLEFLSVTKSTALNWTNAHRLSRPSSTVSENPHEWFLYAYRRIRLRCSHLDNLSIDAARSTCRIFLEYYHLHIARLRHSKELSGSTASQLAELETLLTTDAISSLRARARKEVMAEEVSSFATREWLRWALFNNEMSIEREELANEVRKSLQVVDSGRNQEAPKLDCTPEAGNTATTISGSFSSTTSITKISGSFTALNISVSSYLKNISFFLEGLTCSGLYGPSYCEHTATLRIESIQVAVDRDLVGGRGRCKFLNSPYPVNESSDALPLIEVTCNGFTTGGCSLNVVVRPFHVLATTRAIQTVVWISQEWLDAFAFILTSSSETPSELNSFLSEFSLEAECGTSITLVCSELIFSSEELLTISFIQGGTSWHIGRDNPSEVKVNGTVSAATFQRKSSDIFDIIPGSKTFLSTAVNVLLTHEDTLMLHFQQLDGSIDISAISQLLMTATNLQAFVAPFGPKNQERSAISTNSDINKGEIFVPIDLRIDSAKITICYGSSEDRKSLCALFYHVKLTFSQGKQWNFLMKSCRLSEVAFGSYVDLSNSSCGESALSISCGFSPPSSRDYRIESKVGSVRAYLTLPGLLSILRLGEEIGTVVGLLTSGDSSVEQPKANLPKVNGSCEVLSLRIGLHDMGKSIEFGLNVFLVSFFDDAISGSVQVIEVVGEENNQSIGRPILQIPSIPLKYPSASDHVGVSFRLSGVDNQIVIESLCVNLTGAALDNFVDLGSQISTIISSELTAFSDGIVEKGAERRNQTTKLVVSCQGVSIFIHHEMDVIVIRAGFLSSSTERNLFSISARSCSLSVNYGASDLCSSIPMVEKFSSTVVEDVDWNLRHAYRAKGYHASNSDWTVRFLGNLRVRIIPDDFSKILSVVSYLLLSSSSCFRKALNNSVTNLDAERQIVRQRTTVELSLPKLYLRLAQSSNRIASIGFIEMNGLDVQSRSERSHKPNIALVQTLMLSCRSITISEISSRRMYVPRMRIGLPAASNETEDFNFGDKNNGVRVELVSRIDGNQKSQACDILLNNFKLHYEESFVGVFLSFADEIQGTINSLLSNSSSDTDTLTPPLQDQSIATLGDSTTRITVRLEHSHIAALAADANREATALVLNVQGIYCYILVSAEGHFFYPSHLKLRDAVLSLSRWSAEGGVYSSSPIELDSFDIDQIFSSQAVDKASTKGRNTENLYIRDCVSKYTIASVQAASFRIDQPIPKRFSLHITKAHVIANIHDIAQAVHIIMFTFFVGQALGSDFSIPNMSISVQGICFRITVENGTRNSQLSGGFVAGVDGVLQCAIHQGGRAFEGRLKIAAFIEEIKGDFHDDILQSTTLKIIKHKESRATISTICERLVRISLSPNSAEAVSVLTGEIRCIIAKITDILQVEGGTVTGDALDLLVNIELPGLTLRFLSNTPRTQLLRLSLGKVIFLYALSEYTEDIRLKISDFLLEDTSPWRMFSRYHEASNSKWSRIISAYRPTHSIVGSSSHSLSTRLLRRKHGSDLPPNDRLRSSSFLEEGDQEWLTLNVSKRLVQGLSFHLVITGFEVNLNVSMLPAYSTWINQIIHASFGVKSTTANNGKQNNLDEPAFNPPTFAEGSVLYHIAVCDVPLLISLLAAPGRQSSSVLSGFMSNSGLKSVSDLEINLPSRRFEQKGSLDEIVGRIRSAYLRSVSLQLLNLGLFRMHSLRQLVGVVGRSVVNRRTIVSRKTQYLQRTHVDPSVKATGLLIALRSSSGAAGNEIFTRHNNQGADFPTQSGASSPTVNSLTSGLFVETLDLTTDTAPAQRPSAEMEGRRLFRMLRQKDMRLPRNEKFERYFPFSFDECMIVTSSLLIFTSRSSGHIRGPIITRTSITEVRRNGSQIFIGYRFSVSPVEKLARTGRIDMEVMVADLSDGSETTLKSFEFQCLSAAYSIRVCEYLSKMSRK